MMSGLPAAALSRGSAAAHTRARAHNRTSSGVRASHASAAW